MFKKVIPFIMVVCIVISCFPMSALAASTPVTLVINRSVYQYPGTPSSYLDSATSKAMIPAKSICRISGARVAWNETKQYIKILYESKTIIMPIGSYTAYVNGIATPIDTPCVKVNGVSFVPVGFVANNLGLNLAWVATSSTVMIGVGQYTDKEGNSINFISGTNNKIAIYGSDNSINVDGSDNNVSINGSNNIVDINNSSKYVNVTGSNNVSDF